MTYPRDLAGYGRNPPNPRWPGEARIAVQFVLNHEEGGENSILHGDPTSEAFLSEIVGAQPWPGQRHMNMESLYEYGSRAGFWRLWRLFTERKLPLTVFAVATALQRTPECAAAMGEAGWEIASHGLKWIDYRDFTAEAERAHLAEAIRIHAEVTGARPTGWYTGRTSMHTIPLVAEEGGFLYSADVYADDLPYWAELETAAGPRTQLMVPYALDSNDMRFATPQGFNAGDQFFTYLRDSFDVLWAEGETAPKMLSIGLHSRLAGRPGRIAALARFLDHIGAHDRVWVATRLDIARHWARRHRPAGLRPRRLGRALFVELFGDVFEHSPWVAEAAHTAGLGPEADDPGGLAAAMSAAMRAAPRERQLELIRAHPDLAGRLQPAELTADSAGEQAGAGLAALRGPERERFLAWNGAYTSRFGFPFIMAVKGKSVAEITAAFDRRLAHEPEQEFATALDEIARIAELRLRERMG